MRIAVALQVLVAIAIFAAMSARLRPAPDQSNERRVDWAAARRIVDARLVAPLRARQADRPRFHSFSRAAPAWQSEVATIRGYELVALGDELGGELTVHRILGGSTTCGIRIDLEHGDVLVIDGGVEYPSAAWMERL